MRLVHADLLLLCRIWLEKLLVWFILQMDTKIRMKQYHVAGNAQRFPKSKIRSENRMFVSSQYYWVSKQWIRQLDPYNIGSRNPQTSIWKSSAFFLMLQTYIYFFTSSASHDLLSAFSKGLLQFCTVLDNSGWQWNNITLSPNF